MNASGGSPSRPARSRAAVGSGDNSLSDEWELIVATCRRLMAGTDRANVTVQEILDATSLSTRAFYRLFDSKEDLIASVLRADARAAALRMFAAMGRAGSPTEALTAWVDAWLTVVFTREAVAPFRAAARTLEPGVLDAVREVRRDINAASRGALAMVIEAGLDRGVFARGVPWDDARAFQAIVDDLLDQRIRGDRLPKRAALRADLLDLVARALGGGAPSA